MLKSAKWPITESLERSESTRLERWFPQIWHPGACSVIGNVGMMCLWALLQAAARAEDFDEWAFGPGQWPMGGLRLAHLFEVRSRWNGWKDGKISTIHQTFPKSTTSHPVRWPNLQGFIPFSFQFGLTCWDLGLLAYPKGNNNFSCLGDK